MKYSNNYFFYPSSNELLKGITHYKTLVGNQDDADDAIDSSITSHDVFLYTRGNFEQRLYNGNVFKVASEELKTKLTEKYRKDSPQDWAMTQNSLGNILAALGQQTQGTDLYQNALVCFNHALEVYTQQAFPMDWAMTQYNLGTVQQSLGCLLNDSKILSLSIDAYTNALLEWSFDEMPEQWSLTMYQLGVSFHAHGKELKGNRSFQKSVVSFKNALKGFNADDSALELAATHNSRGIVLQNLGESEENAERLEEAVRSYQTALTICMEQQLPIHLAILCRVNMATARGVLAELTKSSVIASETADDFEVIIELFSNSCQPLALKHCKQQLNQALLIAKEFSI